MSAINISRRTFIKGSAIAGGGLVIGYSLFGSKEEAKPFEVGQDAYAPNLFLEFLADNSIKFHCPRDEMGQGITTGLVTLIAEDLDASPSRFKVVPAGVHDDYVNPEFSAQMTGGSTSIRAHYQPLRQMAANVRALFIKAASLDLGVPAASIRTQDAQIIVAGAKHPYAHFLKTAATLDLPEETPLKDAADFRYIGIEFPRIDALEKSTGTAVYGIDIDLPDMHYVAVLHSPVSGGKLKSFDASAAESQAGVTDVVETSYGVAVVAQSYWQAHKAVQSLKADWSLPELAKLSSQKIRARYQDALLNEPGTTTGDEGDLEAGFADADQTIEAQYWAPYLSHATMEPMNAVARVQDGKLEVWSGTQSPVAARNQLVRRFGLDEDAVHFHNTYSGGGFGRRTYLDHVLEAAEVAMLTKRPVKLIFSREDDIRESRFRPASLMSIKAGVNTQGALVGWQAKRVGNNVGADSAGAIFSAIFGSGMPKMIIDMMGGLAEGATDGIVVDPTSVEGLLGDYDFANKAVAHVTIDDGLPLGFWRSVGHSFSAFAKESAMDEIAHAADLDPVQLRLANTKKNPRLHQVIRAVQKQIGRLGRQPGRYVGFAAHGSFESYVAEAAEISLDGNKIRVHKVICAVDCGRAINPDNVRMQMEGAIMFGLTAALYGDIELKDGVVQQSNFHDYQILRMNEAPDVEVILIESQEPPSGVGEPGLPPIAPAVANAVFAASGQRLRDLPLRLS